MVTIEELLEIIKEEQIPLDAEIFIEADHGQHKEGASSITVSRSELENDPEDMIWEYGDLSDYYDEESLKEYDPNGKITAITVFGW